MSTVVIELFLEERLTMLSYSRKLNLKKKNLLVNPKARALIVSFIRKPSFVQWKLDLKEYIFCFLAVC